MVKLGEKEKQTMCNEMVTHLQKLREVMKASQDELGNLCGLARTRISQVETGAATMSWIQFMAFMMVFSVNYDTKQYIFANRLFAPRLLQYLQRKEENIPPDTSIDVRKELIMSYEEFQAFYKEFNSVSN
ncbi:MAG TPA: helix-turn-helix transcriptional regulator [Spirochaetia bacterium]|nr:helix-turn-helix transcriptional regulator [Spirochaetia bacterium]